MADAEASAARDERSRCSAAKPMVGEGWRRLSALESSRVSVSVCACVCGCRKRAELQRCRGAETKRGGCVAGQGLQGLLMAVERTGVICVRGLAMRCGERESSERARVLCVVQGQDGVSVPTGLGMGWRWSRWRVGGAARLQIQQRQTQ